MRNAAQLHAVLAEALVLAPRNAEYELVYRANSHRLRVTIPQGAESHIVASYDWAAGDGWPQGAYWLGYDEPNGEVTCVLKRGLDAAEMMRWLNKPWLSAEEWRRAEESE